MRSTGLFLLAVCCVVASGEKVELHVKELTENCKRMEFRSAFCAKSFTISTDETKDDNIKKSSNAINEDSLELPFAVESAVVLEVTKAAIKIISKSDCAANENCFKQEANNYIIHVSGIDKKQVKMTCQVTGTDPVEFILAHTATGPSIPDAKVIKVIGGVIAETAFPITGVVTECVIPAVEAEKIPVAKNKDCSATTGNCFKSTAAFDNSFKLGLFAICILLGKLM